MTPTYEQVKLWFADPVNVRKFFGNFEAQESGCQLWMGPFFDGGHGLYTFDGQHVRAHRLRWIIRREADLPDDICIRHWACANKACGNPAHLVGGTWNDNREDQYFIDGDRKNVFMAFGPGHDTGGEPGSVRRKIEAKSVYSVNSKSRAAERIGPSRPEVKPEGEIEI